jgi:hypothetical protein
MTGSDNGLRREMNALYERYGVPLEAEHSGEFVAISKSGDVVLGDDLAQVVHRAKDVLGPGNFVFRVGQRAVGRWRPFRQVSVN